jgi:(2Fe-2S) ferredoxin
MARTGMPRRFAFVCLNERAPGHPRGSCAGRGAAAVFDALREETGRQGLTDVKVVAAGCLEACMVGPVVYVAPDDVWYGGITVEDVPALVAEHLDGGVALEPLRIGREEFELSPLAGRDQLPPGVIPPVGAPGTPGTPGASA